MNYLKTILNKKKDGFTLVELLVVIAIIAILSVTAYVSLGGQTVKARDSKRMEDLSTMQSALELYFIENNEYPDVPLVQGTNPGEMPKKYLSIIPTDPGSAGNSYLYAKNASTFQIAATLEKDGDPVNYETYTVGNGDGLLETSDGMGRWNSGGTLTSCTDGVPVVDGQIGTSADTNCIPYNPNS